MVSSVLRAVTPEKKPPPLLPPVPRWSPARAVTPEKNPAAASCSGTPRKLNWSYEEGAAELLADDEELLADDALGLLELQ